MVEKQNVKVDIGGGLVGAIMFIGLVVSVAIWMFPNAGWPLWLVAISTVIFWIAVISIVVIVVFLILAFIATS